MYVSLVVRDAVLRNNKKNKYFEEHIMRANLSRDIYIMMNT